MRLQDLLHHRIFAWTVIVLTIIMTGSMISNLWQVTHRPDNTVGQAEEVRVLENQLEQLKKDIEKQQSPENQEKVIRDQLNMQKEGEVIIQLPPLPTPTPFPTPNPSPTPQIYQQWWSVLTSQNEQNL